MFILSSLFFIRVSMTDALNLHYWTVGFVIILMVLLGIFGGFFVGWGVAKIYNSLARRTGGVRIDFRLVDRTLVPTAPGKQVKEVNEVKNDLISQRKPGRPRKTAS